MKTFLVSAMVVVCASAYAQQGGENEGELDDVEIEIVKERQIALPQANRNFEKIPPRPSEPLTPPIQYDFKPFSFQTVQINPLIRPLRIKQESSSKIYGGSVSAGYGNYASPYLEGFINSRKDKKKLVGAHAYLNSSNKGPVDGKFSGSGVSGVSLYGKSFGEVVTLSGDVSYDNRTTHFYGYPSGNRPANITESDVRQAYNQFKLNGALSNAKNTDFSYTLGAGFSYLKNTRSATETEVDFDLNSGYKLDEESTIAVKAGYYLINRKDVAIEAKPRNLFFVNPRYEFRPMEQLKFSAGIVAAVEGDTLDNKNVHAYPDFRASYALTPFVDVVASLTGGIEKVSLQTLSKENIWVTRNIPIFHTNKLYDLQAAINSRLGNKVSVSGGFSFAALKNWYFFVNSPLQASEFTPLYDPGTTTRLNLFASLGFVQTEKAKVMLRGDFYTYGTDEVTKAWHRPTYKVTGETSFNIVEKVLLDINLIAQGGMKAPDPFTGATINLDPAIDLNVRTEYLISDSFSVFAEFNNIFGKNYPAFLYYPVRGFQGMGGITWNF